MNGEGIQIITSEGQTFPAWHYSGATIRNLPIIIVQVDYGDNHLPYMLVRPATAEETVEGGCGFFINGEHFVSFYYKDLDRAYAISQEEAEQFLKIMQQFPEQFVSWPQEA